MCICFVNIPEPVRYDIYTLAFPFDLRCESGNTFTPKIKGKSQCINVIFSYNMGKRDLPDIYT